MVEESLENGKSVGGKIPDPDEFLNLMLLPYTPHGFDAFVTVSDYSQLITDFYEN